ncbi:putative non-specific serine/threonine protein kinase [Medicago truncatula]|uniref:LRR receptor-like kinase family protein n=1 Tax=Medicago truncatula TaxID=3880 RepID=G7JY71_MEDTR|nr:LRR receptor-like kinase family protein [Medicago truncatula]RHN55652.1 putative non-specific serine/threonine protein kinase [Medicago truncatula]
MGNYILKLCYALFFILLHSASSIHGYFNSTSSTKEVKCKEREKEALLRFKQGHQDDYGMLSTWRDDEKNRDCCKWKGIGCNNLVGVIPCELGNLAKLQYLNLGGNSLSGAIPYQLGNLAQLQFLDLGDNLLDRTIPFKIGELLMLQSLWLGRNSNLKINKEKYGIIPFKIGELV